MINLKSSGTRKFVDRMRKDIEGIKGTVAATHRRLCATMFVDLVKHTPQWSGNLALNWYVEVHGHTASYAETQKHKDNSISIGMKEGAYLQRYQRGDEPAVGQTLAREADKFAEIRWNSVVTFVNKAPYAQEIEDDPLHPNPSAGRTNWVRDENRLASYGGVAMVGYIDKKYKHLSTLKAIWNEEKRRRKTK